MIAELHLARRHLRSRTRLRGLDPASPGGIGNLNNFVYAGTVGGKIFVTQTGGGTVGGGNAWTDISTGLDGSPVLKIVTNPTRGNHEAYAVTQQGVYHTEDSLASGVSAVWTRITSNLLSILNPAFDDPTLADTQAKYLQLDRGRLALRHPRQSESGEQPNPPGALCLGRIRSLSLARRRSDLGTLSQHPL